MGPPKKLSLPANLLRQLDQGQAGSSATGKGRRSQQSSRKEQRKAHRVQKKQANRPLRTPAHPVKQVRRHPVKPQGNPQHDDGVDGEDDDDLGSDLGSEGDLEEDSDEVGEDDKDDEESGEEVAPQLSNSDRRKLEKDDAEIAALEKKLGMKGKKKSKALDEDGLGELLDGLEDDDVEDEKTVVTSKRKAEADEWLAQKRRKAQAVAAKAAHTVEDDDSSDELEEDGLSDLEGSDFDEDSDGGEDDDDDEDDGEGNFSGFSDEDSAPVPRQRENPYVAPTTGVAKYVPPSLRKKSSQPDSEADAQLRRRLQGLINRLTNDSMIGIVKDVSGLYENFPRQSVTTTLVDLLISLVASPEKRPDVFFAMIAGFVAGLQKALGTHIAANMIQQLVELFKEHHDRASGDQSDAGSKHLIALLAELYNMQVVGANLVLDYVRLFLADLSELNTELLLRIIQMCGPSLRRDDPHALKDIVNQVKPSALKNVSVRTSFMIEEMQKLQSNKSKAAARNKDIAEQRTQIRKRIGTLTGPSDSQTLRIGLKDIQNADRNGKWWVVGASWSGNREKDQSKKAELDDDIVDDAGDLADDDDLGIPDLWQLARDQGFNTDVRQRIFVALHAATDYENADLLIQKLRLNKHQRKEVPEVIVRSSEAQAEYNRYYYLVATRFCGSRELAFQFKRSLTTRFRKMGEDVDTGEGDDPDGEDGEEYDTRWVYNAGRFYGSLVANRSLGLDVLRYRNLAALQEKSQMFVEVLLITALQECPTKALDKIFGVLEPDLARGVKYFMKKYVRRTDLLDGKDAKKVTKRWEVADAILQASMNAVTE